MKNIEKIKASGIFTNYIYKAIPLAFDESMSYYETLCGVLNLLKNQEIIVNNNADALIELQNYVTHYFDNLDVQQEINNKLDEMVENGQLEELIAMYIKNPIKGVLTVNQDGRFIVPKGDNITSGESKSSYSNAQGFCIVDSEHFIQLYLNRDTEEDVLLVEYNPKSGYVYRSSIVANIGHSNSCVYKNGYLYITPYGNNNILKLNYNSLVIEATYTLDVATKYICKDTTKNKMYVGNDVSMYEWEIDTTNVIKLFDIVIPEFINQNTGYLQDIAINGNFIYLLTSSYLNSKIIIFVFNLDGSLYTSYDLGTHNNYMYYGEGEGLDNIGNDFYLVSRYDADIYNDYSVVSLTHFNPIQNIFAKKEMYPNDGSTQYRIVNYDTSKFFADGSVNSPFKYYFEFLIANSLVPYNMGMSLYGSKQPKMSLLNETNVYIIDNDNNCIIDGLNIYNCNGVLQGLKVSRNNAVSNNSIVFISRSNIRIFNCSIGDPSSLNDLHCLYLQDSVVVGMNNSYNTNNIPINNSNSLFNDNCLSTTSKSKNTQFQGKTIINVNTSPISGGSSTINFNDNLKKLLSDNSQKQLYIMLHVNNTYNYEYFNITNLTNSDTTTSKIIFIRDAGKIYSANVSITYNIDRISISISGVYDANGNSASPNISGSLNYKIIF